MHIFETIVTVGLVVAGCFVAMVPTKYLLKMDQRSGQWIYAQEMKAFGDEKKAFAKAATFYRTLGICMIVMAVANYLSIWVLTANSR